MSLITKHFSSYIDRRKYTFYGVSDTVGRNYEIMLLYSELILHKQIADETLREEIVL